MTRALLALDDSAMAILSPVRVVDSLISARLLDATARHQALAVLATLDASPPRLPAVTAPPSRRAGLASLVEVVAYLGGALVLGAGGLLVAESWADLSFGSQVVGLVVAASALGVAGVLVSRRSSDGEAAPRRLASTLLTGCALVAGGLAALVVDHAGGTPTDASLNWTWLSASAVVLLLVVTGRRLADSALTTLVLLGSVVNLVGAAVMPVGDAASYLLSAAAYLVVAIGWAAHAERFEVRDVLLRRVLGVGLALYAAQTPLFGGYLGSAYPTIAYALTALVVAATVAAYLRLRSWPYLAGAVIGVTIVVPEAVSDWTGGGLGATGAVLLTGLTLLAAAVAGTRLRRQPA